MRGSSLSSGTQTTRRSVSGAFLPFMREGVKNGIVIYSDSASEQVLPKEREG
jgi:hypothetical protein